MPGLLENLPHLTPSLPAYQTQGQATSFLASFPEPLHRPSADPQAGMALFLFFPPLWKSLLRPASFLPTPTQLTKFHKHFLTPERALS